SRSAATLAWRWPIVAGIGGHRQRAKYSACCDEQCSFPKTGRASAPSRDECDSRRRATHYRRDAFAGSEPSRNHHGRSVVQTVHGNEADVSGSSGVAKPDAGNYGSLQSETGAWRADLAALSRTARGNAVFLFMEIVF